MANPGWIIINITIGTSTIVEHMVHNVFLLQRRFFTPGSPAEECLLVLLSIFLGKTIYRPSWSLAFAFFNNSLIDPDSFTAVVGGSDINLTVDWLSRTQDYANTGRSTHTPGPSGLGLLTSESIDDRSHGQCRKKAHPSNQSDGKYFWALVR